MASMAELAALYSTVVSRFTFTPSAWQLILKANPKRVYVQFINPNAGAANIGIGPGGIQSLPTVLYSLGGITEFKFKDAPAMVTGEWYGNSSLANTIYMIEQLYNGD